MTTVTESSLRSITSSNRARRSSVTSGSRVAIAVSGSTPTSIVGAGPKISAGPRTPADRRRILRSGHGLAHDVDDANHVTHHVFEHGEGEGLRSVGERLGRIGMNFDHDPVDTGCSGGASER